MNTRDFDRTSVPHRVVVVGGGISGLTVAWRLTRAMPSLEVTVLERDPEPGGTARSVILHANGGQDGDFVADRGPSSFMGSARHVLELIDALELRSEVLEADDAARKRWLFVDGRLEPLPRSPMGLLTSSLLDRSDRLRMLLEPFTPSAPTDDDTVYQFARRHLGDGFARALVEPLLLGITAGDARRLSMRALFPNLHRLERTHRSLFLALALHGMRRLGARISGAGDETERTFGRRAVLSLRGGIGTLTSTLAERLGGRVQSGIEVAAIERSGPRRWSVAGQTADGDRRTWAADSVVLATPAHVSARLVEPLSARMADELRRIPYAGVRVATLAYDQADVPAPTDGFGFLVPRGSGRQPGSAAQPDVRILGCLYMSSLFPEHARPPRRRTGRSDHVLLRVIAGGVLDPALLELDDDDALAVIQRDLKTIMGIDAPPRLAHLVTMRRAIPQYTLGHSDRVSRAHAEVGRCPGLHLAGNAYLGLGLDDCIGRAGHVAVEVADELPAPMTASGATVDDIGDRGLGAWPH